MQYFSPTDFIQIKGRGTRTYTFKHEARLDGHLRQIKWEKENYKLFDFFANCEYFEEKFDYDWEKCHVWGINLSISRICIWSGQIFMLE